MWTPKRIVLLVCGYVVVMLGYLGYGQTYVGRLDGLPPLPEIFRPGGDGDQSPVLPPDLGRPIIVKKLREAFGPDCPQQKWPIRLDLHSRNMTLAAEQFQLTPDGRIRLSPLCVALYGKDRGKSVEHPEISTMSCEIAFLKFDQPIANFQEVNGRKIIEAELLGKIEVTNNRRRKERDEDLVVRIPSGPLYYDAEKYLIRTSDQVTLIDHRSKPNPHIIRGQEMMMQLETEPPPAAARPAPGSQVARPKRNDNITGVRWVFLRQHVDMKLYVDGKSGFLGQGNKETPGKAKGAPAAPSLVHIHTPGWFRYELNKDHDLARFEIPQPESGTPAHSPRHITVVRHHPKGERDRLLSQTLTLRLKKRPQGGKAPPPVEKKPAEGEHNLNIEWAKATGKDADRGVVLTSDAEKMSASGQVMVYDADKKLTVVKGFPEMQAEKDGHVLHARELEIQELPEPIPPGKVAPKGPPKTYRKILAHGPGSIHMLDRATDRVNVHAYWRDRLTSTRDGPHDLLTLVGAARYVNDEQEQELEAETIKVWLEPVEPGKAQPVKEVKGGEGGRFRPHHVEAITRVTAHSRDLNIQKASRMVVWVKNVASDHLVPRPPSGAPGSGPPMLPGPAAPPRTAVAAQPLTPPPPPGGVPAKTTGGGPVPSRLPVGPSVPATPAPAPPPGSRLGKPTTADAKTPRPLYLSARNVEVWVVRGPSRQALEKAWTEGDVHVRQDPAKPQEQDTDIRGDTLLLTRKSEGDVIVVTGDLAKMRQDKLFICGPEVNIDLGKNQAWVHGAGAMQNSSATDLQGQQLKEDTPMTIRWQQSMFFNGYSADFVGGVAAEQQDTKLLCHKLQCDFDRPIVLARQAKKEPAGPAAKDEPAGRIKTLVCWRDVVFEQDVFENGKRVEMRRLVAPSLEMQALESNEPERKGDKKPPQRGYLVHAHGPGHTRIFHKGSKAEELNTPIGGGKKAPAGKGEAAKEEMYLTFIWYGKRMDSNTQKKTAKFYENVRVLSLPATHPNLAVDLDTVLAGDLPEGAMYLTCDRLDVLDAREGDKGNQQFEARGRVFVQGRDYYARSEVLYFNRIKNQLILDGADGGSASLYKRTQVGAPYQGVVGKRIIHNRGTGKTQVLEALEVTASPP